MILPHDVPRGLGADRPTPPSSQPVVKSGKNRHGGRRIFLLLALALVLPPGVSAQASPTLPADHPAHLVLEHLVAAGAVPPFPRGEGARTRAMVARVLATADSAVRAMEADANSPAMDPATRARLVRRASAIRDLVTLASRGLEEELALARRGGAIVTRRWLDRGDLVVTALDSPPRDLPRNGLGTAELTINPLGALGGGTPLGEGTTVQLSSSHAWGGGGPLALQFRPRLSQRGERGSDPALQVQQASVRIRLQNMEIRGGRDILVREQSIRTGLVLSSGPRNWDLLEVGTAEPVRLPWILDALGPVEASAFWAHLGRGQTFPNGWMVGYRGSLRPHPRLELGGTALFQQGGEGGPEASWKERFLDALLIPDLLDTENDYLFSNKLVGADARLRLPWGRGVELFVEGALDDFDHRRLRSTVVDNGAVALGVFVPSLDPDGRVSLALEVQRTGGTLYRHSRYRTGFTLEERAVGSSLGSDGSGGYLRMAWFQGGSALVTLEGAVEEYRADRYRVFGEPDFRYERVETLPRERRVRGVVSMDWSPPGRMYEVLATVGGERVGNPGFEEGEGRTNLLASLGVGIRP